MKKLLNTLYILSDDVYLALDGENVVAWKGKEITGRIPLHTLESIASFSYKGASPSLMGGAPSGELTWRSSLREADSWHAHQA